MFAKNHKRAKLRFMARTAGALTMFVAASLIRAGDELGVAWNWPLPPRQFGNLSQPERVEYMRAEELLRKKNYEAAAIEFEKFMAQYPKISVHPHALLLQAYSLHLAKQRNNAIRLYTEVLDFYADSLDEAVPAAYLKANAQIENGNVEMGIRTLEDLVENEKYLQHPVADSALNQLAQYYLTHDNKKSAERCWLKVIDLFAEAFIRPEDAVREAWRQLTNLYVLQGRCSALEKLMDERGPDFPKMRESEKAVYVYDRASAVFGRMDTKSKAAAAFFKWFTNQKDEFVKADKEQDYMNRALMFAFRMCGKNEWSELVKEAFNSLQTIADTNVDQQCFWITERLSEASRAGWKIEEVWKSFSSSVLAKGKSLPMLRQIRLYDGLLARLLTGSKENSGASVFEDVLIARSTEIYESFLNPERDEGLASLVDWLKNADQVKRAYLMASRIQNPIMAEWKVIELLLYERKYAEAAKACEELEKIDTGEYAAKAVRLRAKLYKEHLARYKEAIELFNLINEPPATVWSIVDCYERWGKPQEAVDTCTEIENFFEADAPAAALRKGMIWRGAGDSKKAIAEFRVVLKKYQRHQVSSQAHQRLEEYGIATGGGVLESMD